MILDPRLSLEERVNVAYRRLVLIQAAAAADHGDGVLNAEEIFSAIYEATDEALEALEPIRHAPATLANWRPPTAKERAS